MKAVVEPGTILDHFTVVENRAIVYARVSTDEQAESGTSLDNQVEKSMAYAQAHNMQVVQVFKEDYTGKVLDRPELNKVREMLRTGQADNLIVYKTNRLDRSEWGLNLLILLQELKALGVSLHYSQSGRQVNLNNPVEALMQSIEGWQAGEDHRETVTKLHEGRLRRAKDGYVVPHGKAPYGYRAVKIDKKWHFQIEETEAAIVKLIFEWYLEGLTQFGIASRLSKMGVPTPSGDSRWRKVSVANILVDETYCGLWHYGKRNKRGRKPKEEHIPVEVPAIVSREVWEAVKTKLEHNKRFARRNRKYLYLLANRVTCGVCGYRMTGSTAKVSYHYYRCPSGINPDCERKCDNPGFSVGLVDTKVWDKLEEVSRDKEKLIAGLRGYQARQESTVEPIKRELAYVEQLIVEKNSEWQDDLASMKFLTSDRARAKKAADIAQVEAVLDGLEKRKVELLAQLEEKSMTDEQITSIVAYAAQVAEDMATLREAEEKGQDRPELKAAVYEAKRRLLAILDVQVTLFVEDDKRKARMTAKYRPDGEVFELSNAVQ